MLASDSSTGSDYASPGLPPGPNDPDACGEETLAATLSEEVIPGGESADVAVAPQWGHFRILERLGQGGMGAVYRARDESLQRDVALKVIADSKSGEAGAKQTKQLFREARAQARVNHPNVVHIYFVDESHGKAFFAMELVRGPTLKDRLQDGPLPFGEVVRMGLQVAAALQHALRFEIVHGDIKPSNLLVTDAGDVKVSDFGLARTLSELDSQEGVLAGTPNYLSPEAARRSSTDFRSDLYSLGVTLFELTFGKLPYSYGTDTVEERLEAHQSRPVNFPLEWPETVPIAWRGILERLLAKDPESRYRSYDELMVDLRSVRPSGLLPAGLLPRGLAWFTDLAALFLLTVVIHFPIKLGPLRRAIGENPILELLIPLVAGVAVPALAIGLQWSRGTSPGKKLFQLRIVDRHGSVPGLNQIAGRTAFQFWFLWVASFFGIVEAFGWEIRDGIIIGLALVPVLVEMGSVLVSKQRLALHDRLFRTQVVVDTRRLETSS